MERFLLAGNDFPSYLRASPFLAANYIIVTASPNLVKYTYY